MRRLAWLALPLLAACGSTPAPAPPPPDETLGRAARAGRLALELDRPAEATRLYGTALARARERDDAAAIADAGIGLAAAELARNRNAAALATAREVQAELLRRNAPVPDALRLMAVEQLVVVPVAIRSISIFRVNRLVAIKCAIW